MTALEMTPHIPSFRESVEATFAEHRDKFNFENIVQNHLDISRFGPWVAQAGEYRKIEGSTVLSSGCGSAGDLWTFMEQGAARVYGLEIEKPLVSLARERFQNTIYEKQAKIDLYDGTVLPFAQNSFDIVFSMHVLEHTKNVVQYLTELFRVLKPGGVLFLDLPNRYYPIEQHTELKYIHYLPRRWRDLFIRGVCSPIVSRLLSDDYKFRLESLIDFHIPSPAKLMQCFESSLQGFRLGMHDAFFHSNDRDRLSYQNCSALAYFFGQARRMTTFRLVVSKKY